MSKKDFDRIEQIDEMVYTAFTKKDAMQALNSFFMLGRLTEDQFEGYKQLIKEEFSY